jgi:hypothetical protein
VTQFPTIFRWSDLPTATPNAKLSQINLPYQNGTPTKPNKAVPQKPQNHSSSRQDSWNSYGTDAIFGADEQSSGGDYGRQDANEWGLKQDEQKVGIVPCKYFKKVLFLKSLAVFRSR